ncbi:hypothetical protein FORC47_2521 [Bacillus cereus]|nr:hypothetical protein FORC47_2521 [Bacillus cereus]
MLHDQDVYREGYQKINNEMIMIIVCTFLMNVKSLNAIKRARI